MLDRIKLPMKMAAFLSLSHLKFPRLQENEKRAVNWYLNILGLSSLVMENGSRLLLMEWGENHKPIVVGTVFSLQAPDIHKAHSELRQKELKLMKKLRSSVHNHLGFHVIDSELSETKLEKRIPKRQCTRSLKQI